MNNYEDIFKSSQRAVRLKTGGGAKECSAALHLKSIDIEKRQIRFLASSADLDRDGEIILPTAFEKRLSVYKANPVFLASHQHRLSDGSPPVIGKTVQVWIDKIGLWVIVQFAETPLAEQHWQLYSQDFMRAVSVGFISHASENRPGPGGQMVRVHTDVELLEISAIAVPSNPQALSRSKQKKQAFVVAKIQDREDEKIMAEIRAEYPNFDKDCLEFSVRLMYGEGPNYELPDDKKFLLDDDDVREKDTELNFASLVRGEDKKFGTFKDLVV